VDLALETIRVLQRFKNAVLEGPPGTGKSYVIEAIADKWQAETGRPLEGAGQGKFAVVLHPSTTYEDFVEGLRYDDAKQGFTRQDGFILNVIEEAKERPNADFLVLVDEINRANVPKVLGDLLLCMEASKRSTFDGTAWTGGMVVTLPYSGKKFTVPSNVYLLGTMNTSDRSIAPIDSALRRRFGFVRVEPLMGAKLHQAVAKAEGDAAAERVKSSVDEFTNLNEALRRCLGPNAMLGHSYLFRVGSVNDTNTERYDPLADVRAAAAQPNVRGVLWLEARTLDGGSHNQLCLPDVNATQGRRGIVDAFFPMALNGVVVAERAALEDRYELDIAFAGDKYIGNVIRYNSGGPNHKLYYLGKTVSGEKFTSLTTDRQLEQSVHVWLRLDDDTLDLMLLDRSEGTVAALRAVSAEAGWHERTDGAQGRSYGVIDLGLLADAADIEPPVCHKEAQSMIWRYAILPQLIETTTQAGAIELIDPTTRRAWLELADCLDTEDRWSRFDEFLGSLSLAVRTEGHGVTSGLAVLDIPIGAYREYLPPDTDGAGIKESEDAEVDSEVEPT
jgi:hypothetical protein